MNGDASASQRVQLIVAEAKNRQAEARNIVRMSKSSFSALHGWQRQHASSRNWKKRPRFLALGVIAALIEQPLCKGTRE